MARPSAQPELQIDDGVVRVTRWQFAPGAETGWHRHGYAYVVVPMTTGALTIDTGEGLVTAELTAGVAYNRPAGVEHNVINDNDFDFAFVEVELLEKAG